MVKTTADMTNQRWHSDGSAVTPWHYNHGNGNTLEYSHGVNYRRCGTGSAFSIMEVKRKRVRSGGTEENDGVIQKLEAVLLFF